MRKMFKRLVIASLIVVVGFGGCAYYFLPRPPRESKLIQNFNEQRATFEELKDMLQADGHLRRLASWGVETTKPFFLGYPSEANFPAKRFNQYLDLLKKAGGLGATRDEGEHPNPSIVVWAWGWAGDSKHIGICWMNQTPTHQISTLDGYRIHGNYPNRQVVYRHIDQNWYLWTDQ